MLNLICFAACIEGLFFFGAFAYVYFLRSKGLLHGLAGGTNWVFRDESAHMAFAFEVVATVRREPALFDAALERDIRTMMDEAIECEAQFAEDLLAGGVAGLSVRRDAHVPGVLCRSAAGDARPRHAVRCTQPVRVPRAAGRAGGHQLLRAPGVGVSGRRRGRVSLDAAF